MYVLPQRSSLCVNSQWLRLQAFIGELSSLDGQPAWIVGRVIEGTNEARIVDDVDCVEV